MLCTEKAGFYFDVGGILKATDARMSCYLSNSKSFMLLLFPLSAYKSILKIVAV